jgi:hypothetical protein
MTDVKESPALLAPAFVEKLYEEAMALVHEAADYLGGIGLSTPGNRSGSPPGSCKWWLGS